MGFLVFGLMALAVGVLMGLSAGLGAIGQGKVIAAAIEATARQPELKGDLRFLMIIGLAFIESLVLYGLLISFLLLRHIPTVAELMKFLNR